MAAAELTVGTLAGAGAISANGGMGNYLGGGGAGILLVAAMYALRGAVAIPWPQELDIAVGGALVGVGATIWTRLKTWRETFKKDRIKHGGAGYEYNEKQLKKFVRTAAVFGLCAFSFAGCITNSKGDRVVDWTSIERGVSLYDQYREAKDDVHKQEDTLKQERASFWAASAVVVFNYRQNIDKGAPITEAAMAAVEDANRLLRLVGINKTYVELAQSVFKDEPDRPSDVDLAIGVLRASLQQHPVQETPLPTPWPPAGVLD